MASKAFREGFVFWDTCRGRNGADIPARVADDQCCEAINLYFPREGLGRRRNGSTLIATHASTPAYLGVNAFGYFQPMTPKGPAAATTFIVDRAVPPQILGFDNAWLGELYPVAPDVIENPIDLLFVQFNNKMFVAYDSPVNRLHVIDGGVLKVRRAGLPLAAPPTAADSTVAGTYPVAVRWYRIRWQTRAGGLLQYQSNSSDAIQWTNAAGKQGVIVTRPTPPGESETHWQLEASGDSIDGPFYDIGAPIPIATATYLDTQDVATYDESEAAPEAGANTPFPSVKCLLSTGTRLLGFGVYENTDTGNTGAMKPVMGRVYYTPVTNTTDSNDEERVSNTTSIQGFIDIARPNGQEDRALAGPLNDAVLVFQSFGIWQLYPTDNAVQPYRRVQLDPALGAVNQQSTFMGHDQNGNPCAYFLDEQRGPYRYSTEGFEWLGADLADVWKTFNKHALNKSAHGVYYKESGHVLFWIATGTDNDPSIALVFNISLGRPVGNHEVRGGWSVLTGSVASAPNPFVGAPRCSIVRGFTGSPLIGVNGPSRGIVLMDDPAAVVDHDGSPFSLRLTSKAWGTTPATQNKGIRGGAWVQAAATPGQVIGVSFIANYGITIPTVSQPLDPTPTEGTPTRVLRRFDDAILNDWFVFQTQLVDVPARAATELDYFFATFEGNEERGNQ